MARYIPNPDAVGELAAAREMGEALTELAAKGARFAAGIAPRDTGRYAASFHASSRPTPDGREGVLENTAPYAEYVEWADDYRILGRTVDFLENGT